MSILNRLRRRYEAVKRLTAAPVPGTGEERMNFSAEIPVGNAGPVCRINVQVVSEPHGDGERLRLRAHLQTNFASVLRPALDASRVPVIASGARALTPVQRAGAVAGRGLQRVLATPLMRRVTEPLLRNDVNTWVELQASTASLDDGAHALLPQSEKLAALGIRPAKKSGPVAESWAGQAPDGYAQVSLLQLDKRDLPAQLTALLGARPFHLAAAIVNTVEEK